MEEPPPQQLSSSEHTSSLDLCHGSEVQTGLNLLQSPGSVQLQYFLVHRADQLLQTNQCLAYCLCLLLVACMRSQGHSDIRGTCQRSEVIEGPRLWVTFSVAQDSLDQDRVLCESLCNQQDAFLDAVTTQQRTTTGTLSIMGWRKTEFQHQHRKNS